MIFNLQIDNDSEETITAVVHRRTFLIDEIERLVAENNLPDKIPGYTEDEIIMLDVRLVECFFVESEKTYAMYTNGERYLIKKRLYELENLLPNEFTKLNKSALANWKKIVKFKVHLSGAVDAIFQSGYTECVSRRCFSELKRRYDL